MARLVIATTFANIFTSIGAGLEDGFPVITVPSGNISPYTHTIDGVNYTKRVTDDADLSVAMIEAAPTCIRRGFWTGTATAGGNTLTYTPAIWLYAGDYPGDPAFQQQIDGVAVKRGTGTQYTSGLADGQRTLTMQETFGGVSVASAPLLLDFPSIRLTDPNDLSTKLRYWFDGTNAATVYTDLTKTTNVAANGDLVGCIADRKTGSSRSIVAQGGGFGSWDADKAQVTFDMGDTQYFDLEAPAGFENLTATSEVYFAIKTTDRSFVLFYRIFGTERIFDARLAEYAPTSIGSGAPVHTVDGRAIDTEASGVLSEAVATGEGVVAGVQAADLTAYNGRRNVIFNLSSSFGFTGQFAHLVFTDALTAEERAALVDWLKERGPS